MRLKVFGAGIAGSALTRMARDRGHDVTLVSLGQPASAAALAAVRLSWTAEKERAAESIAWYDEHGWVVCNGARVISQKGEERNETGWWLIDPTGPLVQPDEVREATTADVLMREEGEVLVFALGSGAADAGKLSYGATAIGPPIDGPALQVAHLAPYKSVLVGTAGGFTRVGSSKGKTQPDADLRLLNLVSAAAVRGLIPPDHPWEIIRGARAEARADRLLRSRSYWSLRGYGRLGYTLAPADARELIDRLEDEAS
jgi:hypothetical protein